MKWPLILVIHIWLLYTTAEVGFYVYIVYVYIILCEIQSIISHVVTYGWNHIFIYKISISIFDISDIHYFFKKQ